MLKIASKLVHLAVVLGLLTSMMLVYASPASAVDRSGPYRIKNYGTSNYGASRCMGFNTTLATPGTVLVQHNCSSGAPDQGYWLYSLGNHIYTIRPAMDTNMCVSISGGSNSNGALAVLWPCQGTANQEFNDYTPQFSTIHTLKAQHSGGCLQVNGGWTAPNNAKISQWDCGQAYSQYPNGIHFFWSYISFY
jgi:hypothetical protein